MHPVEVRFTTAQMRVAVLVLLLVPMFRWRVFLLTGAIALLAAVGVAIDVISSQQFVTGVFAFVAIWLIVLGALYITHWRLTYRLFRSLTSNDVTFRFTTEGCAVASSSWSGFLPWTSISRTFRCPLVWLFEISEPRSEKQIASSFLSALEEKQSVPAAEVQAQPMGFPVMWLRPVPLRSFLVVPTEKLSEEHIRFISKASGSK